MTSEGLSDTAAKSLRYYLINSAWKLELRLVLMMTDEFLWKSAKSIQASILYRYGQLAFY